MSVLLPELRGFARFLTRDAAAADDLVQDTLVRALAAVAQFQPGTNLKAWLFTIQRNAFYEQARRRRRESQVLGRESQVLSGQLTDTDPAMSSASLRGEVSDLQRLLFTLTPLLREALVLVGAQELSYEQAAAICGVPVGTVKARVSRARSQIATRLREETPNRS
ncbi:sigma-70 family RNA polymerase sigma factor [Lichenicoccus sp.]|uniref:sigma-70 family RNA polymerase sigma factor n=1 Tax=Lichenicoccus sp. TaxID=2781899 RepID=UPI003D0F9DAD